MVQHSESPILANNRHSQCSEASYQKTFLDDVEATEVLTSSDECQIVLKYNGVRFAVIARPCERSTSDDDAVTEWLSKLEEAQDDPDEMAYHNVVAEIQQIIISTSETLIRSLAASVSVSQQTQLEHSTLERHLYPPTFVLQLSTNQGILQATRMEDPEEYVEMLQPCTISGDFLQESIGFPASDLYFIQDLYIGQVAKVSYKDDVFVFKSAHDGSRNQITREIRTLLQISELRQKDLISGIAIPQFIGLVTSHNQVIGFLEQFIDGVQLSELDLDKFSTSQRRIWRRRIEDTVVSLHKHGIVWGDVKPENVLIHDDCTCASIIDFGGSWTDGWVDEQLAETVEGDLQGLQRLVQSLGLRQ